MFTRLILPLAIFLLAAGWLWWHMRAWQAVQAGEKDDRERQFQARRYRRRMQASGMLALIAVAIAGGQTIDQRANPSLFVWFWFGVIVLVFWMCALALADALSTHLHVSRTLRQHKVVKAQLEAEVNRLRQAAENERRDGTGDE